MARRRTPRKPPTPAQRRHMMTAGVALIVFACFAVLYETVAWEGGNVLALAAASAVLFLVFILPILASLWAARRSRTRQVT